MDSSRIARIFPLVARPRPACLPLAERVQEVEALAREATDRGDLAKAAAAQNRAALIASDCGLPDLARSLCWSQAEACLRARPLGAQAARHTLEPLINLARLLIRDGDGDGAWRHLDNLYRAVRGRTNTELDGRPVSFIDLTDSENAHRTVHRWLWTVVLADGARALTTAGRWSEALRHVKEHRGIGRRLLDGRQVTILAAHSAGDSTTALDLLDTSTPKEPWEEAVAACLRVLCHAHTASTTDEAVNVMVRHYLALQPQPGLAAFHTRLGLATLDLSEHMQRPDAQQAIQDHLLSGAISSADGYAARDILHSPVAHPSLASKEIRRLQEVVTTAGLDTGRLHGHLLVNLVEAARSARVTSETQTRRAALAPRGHVRHG